MALPRRLAASASAKTDGDWLARRLVEVGVPFVEVQLGGWDTHNDNFNKTTNLMGQLDPNFAALIADLKARRLLDSTIVLCMGEFGRTPKINENAGRDHFPRAFSAAMAGGGIRGGQVVGATDARGLEVKENPVQVKDLFATLATTLGLDPAKANVTPEGRPITLVDKQARIVEELLG